MFIYPLLIFTTIIYYSPNITLSFTLSSVYHHLSLINLSSVYPPLLCTYVYMYVSTHSQEVVPTHNKNTSIVTECPLSGGAHAFGKSGGREPGGCLQRTEHLLYLRGLRAFWKCLSHKSTSLRKSVCVLLSLTCPFRHLSGGWTTCPAWGDLWRHSTKF